MRFLNKSLLFPVLMMFFSCHEKSHKTVQSNVFELIPPDASYIIKSKDKKDLSKITFVKAYLNRTDLAFINKLPKSDFTLNIIQNKDKLNGFIVVTDTFQTDSIFNGKLYNYQEKTIYSESMHKRNYYAVQISGKMFISNQKLFLENSIRNQEGLMKIPQDETFIKGVALLDKNAQANVIVNLQQLKPDVFYQSALPLKPEQLTRWEFLDLTDTDKSVFSGMALADTTQVFLTAFNNTTPVEINFDKLVPFSVSQNISFSFDDFSKFYNNTAGQMTENHKEHQIPVSLNSLKGLDFFVENNQRAVLLYLESITDFTGEEPQVLSNFGNYEIYKNEHPELINSYFENILPQLSLQFYTVFNQYVLLAEDRTYLQKVLNDIQNNATLTNNTNYQNIQAELPDTYQFSFFKNRSLIAGTTCMQIHTFTIENNEIFSNFICQPIQKSKDEILIEQVLSFPLSDEPITKPQLVWNHRSKRFNIIYQNKDKELVLLDLKGKRLWKTKLKDKITGEIKQIDLLRNRKLQYTFVTPHHWYVIDRLGRNVEKFPEYFLQKITKGISVFDYENNRKYRFGITQDKKFRLFDRNAKKVKGFKVKTDDEIINPPQHIRIGNKDFILMQDIKGKLYLLNRRGQTRINIKQNFKTFTNQWGAYNRKFVNVDDDNNLISIDLSGKIKKQKLDWKGQILSQIKFNTLAAVGNNKLLINKKIIDLDLGIFNRPQIYRLDKKIYVFIADTDNNRIYAYDAKGRAIDNFPVIGHAILDLRSDRTGRYILTYDDAHNLIVYKF